MNKLSNKEIEQKLKFGIRAFWDNEFLKPPDMIVPSFRQIGLTNFEVIFENDEVTAVITSFYPETIIGRKGLQLDALNKFFDRLCNCKIKIQIKETTFLKEIYTDK